VWLAATKEWPALAKDGGKLGIAKTIAETADKLMILVQAASYAPVRNSAFRRAGVVRSLRDLAFQIYQVKRLASALILPLPPYGAMTF
jgi:ABC-type phosphate transport system permease subunit